MSVSVPPDCPVPGPGASWGRLAGIGHAWSGLKAVGRVVGDIQARIILAVFYFGLVAPFALAIRWSDPLALRRTRPRGWHPRGTDAVSPLERARRQS